MNNIILNSDSYKYSQFPQYPVGTTGVFSYAESRGGEWDATLVAGVQRLLLEDFSKPITQEMIDEAEEIILAHGEPFYREGWEYILKEYNGYLPVRIKAVPEGTIVPVKNVIVTIENTDPKAYWLTNFLETALLRAIWYATTVATNSYESKKIIYNALVESGTPESINFKLHDFGARGVSSEQSAEIGGLAHLYNFEGTDTVSALVAARKYFGTDLAGFSIPAMEHSTVTSWGREGEVDSFRNMLKTYGKPGAMFAAVSDSYDIYNAAENLWGGELRQEVIDSGATLVVRPDSGVPHEVVLKLLEILDDKYGSTVNEKGYKVLNNVRVIQGDGIDHDSIRSILNVAIMNGFSADNIAFGQGGALLQQVNRDTMKFALKCSAVEVNGEWRDVFKDPITDRGKVSKKGRVTLYRTREGEYVSEREGLIGTDDKYWGWTEVLETVFENGKVLKTYTLEEVRERARAEFK